MSKVIVVETKAKWDSELASAGDKLVAVDFTATWCGPCRMIGPVFEALSKEYENVVFLKVDVDENEEVAGEQGISAMPTFKFYRNGEKIDEMVGASPDQLKEKLAKHSGVKKG